MSELPALKCTRLFVQEWRARAAFSEHPKQGDLDAADDVLADAEAAHDYAAALEELQRERAARNAIDPTTRLHNLCDGLAESRRESPYSEESWELVDADNQRLRTALAEAQRERGALIALLREAHKVVDDLQCPNQWKTADGRPHGDLCKRIDAAIAAESKNPKSCDCGLRAALASTEPKA